MAVEDKCELKLCLICGIFKKMNLRQPFGIAALPCLLGLNFFHRT